MMKRSLVRAVLLFVLLAVVTGVVYPLAVTLIAGVAFPFQAHGSLITGDDGQVIGSVLIGQNSSAPFYFQGRPSATPLTPYNASHSGGSNLGPTNPVLLEQVAERVQALREAGVAGPIPADLVMASGSGLDPHISLDAALVQVPAVAKARGLPEEEVRALVMAEAVDSPIAGTYVNVLSLNRALDRLGGGDA
ncbi:MAG TPA: potassium-transporting ATPase subunit KdpC [Candidatus Methanoculleus thermohydrogenotrophicum]|jgi:K+-transporting ATPase ATPase C chain|nr:potassium-transporting ATPase subunit KdpC [Candidatus Methanoculleus thermohydrogenotrophicum]HPZ38002.1 potassium-transporting ATPase subunit KdpC [Candidatus Methanoculleus thermohydrogenotrophicum]HQC91200.1 potassium-transporting ATPase subunit KdpC [Candidatus Methanoculleus thermohydrogenotrophicum]